MTCTKQQLSEAFETLKGGCVHEHQQQITLHGCSTVFECMNCPAESKTVRVQCPPHAEDDGLAREALEACYTADISYYKHTGWTVKVIVKNDQFNVLDNDSGPYCYRAEVTHKDFAAAAIAAIVSAHTQDSVEVE